MKELSMEEKAKAYDEAISRARFYKENTDGVGFKDVSNLIEGIFPELREESEDERIRKELVSYLGDMPEDTELRNGVTNRDVLAWLEKQREQLHTDKVEPRFKIGDTVTVKPMSCHGKVFKGEPFKIVDIIEDNYVSDDGKTYSISLQDGWELVEQKPADKVEPKFKVGYWIVSNVSHEDYRICKILKIENGEYVIESIYGYQGHNNFETFDKDYHLWTLKDAKDGDVLQLGEVTAIFKKYIGNEHCTCYCSFSKAGGFEIPIAKEDNVYGCYNDTTPATKEQRDLLFSKMKEAGYEWDAEKKELKNIEQNSSWSEEDEENLNQLHKLIIEKAHRDYEIDTDDETLWGKYAILSNWLKSLKERMKGE